MARIEKNIVWMMVSNDKYRLPIFMEDTAKELGKRCGVGECTIRSSWAKYKDRSKYIKVVLEGEE